MPSASYRADLQAVNGDDVALVLLEISHPDLGATVRVVNNTEDVTSGGNVYAATAFDLTLPDDRDGQPPAAQLSIVNIGRELMGWLEQAGGGAGATIAVKLVRAGTPSTVEASFTVGVQSITADPSQITATLGYDALLDRPSVGLRYDPITAPGIF